MKINYDCLRDVLITLEKHLTLTDNFNYEEIPLVNFVNYPELLEYDSKQIAYCVFKLAEAQYIQTRKIFHKNKGIYCSIECVTYKGHEFISHTENPDVWKKTTNIAKKIGSVSVSILSQIASNVISNVIISATSSCEQKLNTP